MSGNTHDKRLKVAAAMSAILSIGIVAILAMLSKYDVFSNIGNIIETKISGITVYDNHQNDLEREDIIFRKSFPDSGFTVIGTKADDGSYTCIAAQRYANNDLIGLYKEVDAGNILNLLVSSPKWQFRNYGEDSRTFIISAYIIIIGSSDKPIQIPIALDGQAVAKDVVNVNDVLHYIGVIPGISLMAQLGNYIDPATRMDRGKLILKIDLKGHEISLDLAEALNIVNSTLKDCIDAGL